MLTRKNQAAKAITWSPSSEARRELANLTWRKNPHTRIWCQRICLSVTNFDLNYLRTGEIELAKILYKISLSKSHFPSFFFPAGGPYGLDRGPKSQPFGQVSAIILLLYASPWNYFSKIFNFIPHEIKNQNYFKKSLQVWVIKQFLFAPFWQKKVNLWLNKLPRRALLAGAYEIWDTNFTSAKFFLHFATLYDSETKCLIWVYNCVHWEPVHLVILFEYQNLENANSTQIYFYSSFMCESEYHTDTSNTFHAPKITNLSFFLILDHYQHHKSNKFLKS